MCLGEAVTFDKTFKYVIKVAIHNDFGMNKDLETVEY